MIPATDSALMRQHQAWVAARGRLWPARAKPVRRPPAPIPARREVLVAELEWGVPVNLLVGGSARTIIRLCAARHGVKASDLVGLLRTRPVVAARHEAMALIYTHCRYISLPAIGRMFHRDHTTVLHALQKLRKKKSNVPAPYRISAPPKQSEVAA